jgi:hypothetical protein
MVSAEGMDLSHRRNDLAADHEHEREIINQRHAHSIQARAQQGRHVLQREESEFTREELAANHEAVGEDAHKVRIWAHARGELSARDLADQMRAEEAARAQYAQQLAEQTRLEARRESELDRAERRRADQYERDQRLRLEQRLREDDVDDRDYRRQLTQQEREDRHRREDADREERRQELEYKRSVEQRLKEHQLEVLRQLRASGQLDMVNINTERLIAEVIGVPVEEVRPQPVSWRNDPALTSDGSADSEEQNRAVKDDTFDAEVREEEDR